MIHTRVRLSLGHLVTLTCGAVLALHCGTGDSPSHAIADGGGDAGTGGPDASTGAGGSPSTDGGANGTGGGGAGGAAGGGGSAGGGTGGMAAGGASGTAGTGGADAAATDGGMDAAADTGPTCAPTDLMAVSCTTSGECAGDETCLDGACIRNCGEDLSDMEGTLGDVFTPIAGFCGGRARRALPHVVVEDGCERWRYYNFSTSGVSGSNTINWVLRQYDVDRTTFTIDSADLGTGMETPSWDGLSFFNDGSLGPDGSEIVFSLHDGTFTTGQTFAVSVESPAWTAGPDVSARDVSHLDDTTVLLASGDIYALSLPFSEGGSPRAVITGFDQGAEVVSVLPDIGYVLVGDLYSGPSGGLIDLFFLPLADVTAALQDGGGPIDVSTVPAGRRLTVNEGLRVLGSDYLLTGTVATEGELRRLTAPGGNLAIGDPQPFARASRIESWIYLGSGRVMLGYFATATLGGQIYGTLAP